MSNMVNSQYSFQIEIECPSCSKEVDFVVKEIFQWHPTDGKYSEAFRKHFNSTPLTDSKINIPAHASRPKPGDNIIAFGFGNCPKCMLPVILTIETTLSNLRALGNSQLDSSLARYTWAKQGIKLIDTLPKKETHRSPPGIPDVIAELWPATLQSLERNDPPSRIVTECRSILDVSLKKLGANPKHTRKKQIQSLKDKHILTEGLAAWGEELWDDGNEAVHEIKADAELAERHVDFMKLFFRVAFELPAEIEQRKKARPEN